MWETAPINVFKYLEDDDTLFSKNKIKKKRATTKEEIIELLEKISNILISLEAQIAKYPNNEALHTTYINLVDNIAKVILEINKL